MARGKTLLKSRGKKKAPRISELEKRAIVKKFYGETAPSISNRGEFLNWCKSVIDTDTSREWLDEYLSSTSRSTRGVPNEYLNLSVCHRARLKTLNAPFTEYQDRLLEEGIRNILSHAKIVEEDEGEDRPTIQDRIKEKYHHIAGEIEGLIDDCVFHGTVDWDTFDVSAWLREKEVSQKTGAMILARFRPRLEGLEEKSGYALDEHAVIHAVVEALEKMLENQKRARVTRKPKPVSLEKKLKHINESYLKYSKEWNITSIDPSKIVGAKELWTLNVRYKLLTVFRADNMGGQLDVARCKIVGFNPNDSQTYRLGRGKKQFTVVEEVMKSTRTALKKVVSELKTSDYLLERVNENTVLLRVL